MNAYEVERRLEALAADSARPEVPMALFDRLADLETGNVSIEAPLEGGNVIPLRRPRSSRIKTITGLGLAAALILGGSLVYAAGSYVLRPNLLPSPNITPAPQPTAPVSLGQWTNAFSFENQKANFRTMSLSWQDGQIVGMAGIEDYSGVQQSACVLVSKDMRFWDCSLLIMPADLQCDQGQCLTPNAVSVSNGHWIAVATFHPNDPLLPATILTWTSSDGAIWSLLKNARLTFPSGDTGTIQIIPTATGFAMANSHTGSGTPKNAPYWIAADDTAWHVGTVGGGNGFGYVNSITGDAAHGFVANGWCGTDQQTTACAAFSTDGKAWQMTDMFPGAAPQLVARLSGASNFAATYTDGHWHVYLTTLQKDRSLATDSGYYEATSSNGTDWNLSRQPDMTLGIMFPKYSEAGTLGIWALDDRAAPRIWNRSTADFTDQPNWTKSTYWSAEGLYWIRVSDQPPGVPMAVVETPTQLVAVMAVYPNADGTGVPTLTVWTAPIH